MATKKKITKKKAAAKKKAPAKKKIEAVPAAYGTATPHLIVSPCREALSFYEKAFDAKIKMVMGDAPGPVMHSEIKIGDSIVMMCDEMPPMPGPGRDLVRKSPKNAGSTTGGVMLYVKDTDKWHDRAVAAGCVTSMPPADMFWGDRYAQVVDPYGHVWAIATHIANPTRKQMQAAMAAMGRPPGDAAPSA